MEVTQKYRITSEKQIMEVSLLYIPDNDWKMQEYKKYQEHIMLVGIWIILGYVVFSRYNTIDSNTCMAIILINSLHGLLYKNKVFHRINAIVSLLMMFVILIFKSNICTPFIIVFGLVILLISFLKRKQTDWFIRQTGGNTTPSEFILWRALSQPF